VGDDSFSSTPPNLPRSTERSSELTPKTHDEVKGGEYLVKQSVPNRQPPYIPLY